MGESFLLCLWKKTRTFILSTNKEEDAQEWYLLGFLFGLGMKAWALFLMLGRNAAINHILPFKSCKLYEIIANPRSFLGDPWSNLKCTMIWEVGGVGSHGLEPIQFEGLISFGSNVLDIYVGRTWGLNF